MTPTTVMRKIKQYKLALLRIKVKKWTHVSTLFLLPMGQLIVCKRN
jgi:hypothetical protein